MREIKFRGLNTKGEWVYGSLISNARGIKSKPQTNTKTWIVESAFGNGGWFHVVRRQYVKPETVCQYTGLKDKNGVEIYFGDIIQTPNYGNVECKWNPREASWLFLVLDKNAMTSPHDSIVTDLFYLHDEDTKDYDYNRDYFVIGNIYENRDLL